MNSQKQITMMVVLVFLLMGGCASYTVYDQPREEHALASQQAIHAERGARIFARYCRQCHGNAGEGRIGPALNPLFDPAALAQRNLTANDISDTIGCGRIGKVMPPWAISEGGALTPEQIGDLVTLITTNAGDGWKKAGEYSDTENQAAPVPSVEDVLKGAAITGETKRSCGQLAPATETAAAAGGALPAGLNPAAAWTENATDNKFDVTVMAVQSGQQATVTFNNKGAATHNWHVLNVKDDSGKDITVPLTDGGKSATVSFALSKAGVYNFQCDVHPTEMTGKLYVVGPDGTTGGAAAAPTAAPDSSAASGTPSTGNAATAPTSAAPAGTAQPVAGPGNTTLNETMTDNKFSVTQINGAAGKPITVTVQNKGSAIHNWHVLNVKDDNGKDITTPLTDAGKSNTVTFSLSKPGTYNFQCDVHPTEMKGTLTIK